MDGHVPPILRDVRPNKDWDEKYPYIALLRCQLNVVAYSFLLGPLKAYLIGAADAKVKGTSLEQELRAKGVDVCLDLLDAAERFYKLIYPASVKYFFILFFIFDGATVLCSAIAHDDKSKPSLPKRDRIVLALKNSLHLLEGVSHLSKTAVISAVALRKLMAILPLTAHESMILDSGLGGASKRARIDSTSTTDSSSGSSSGLATTRENSKKGTQIKPAPQPPIPRPIIQGVGRQFDPASMPTMSLESPGYGLNPGPAGEDGVRPSIQQQQQQHLGEAVPVTGSDVTSVPLEHLENLWGWGNLNMDFSGHSQFDG